MRLSVPLPSLEATFQKELKLHKTFTKNCVSAHVYVCVRQHTIRSMYKAQK